MFVPSPWITLASRRTYVGKTMRIFLRSGAHEQSSGDHAFRRLLPSQIPRNEDCYPTHEVAIHQGLEIHYARFFGTKFGIGNKNTRKENIVSYFQSLVYNLQKEGRSKERQNLLLVGGVSAAIAARRQTATAVLSLRPYLTGV